ncbi:MAG: 6,7-dimethyl-8-ribityllumazine synthase [Saprospiraceae bacterium]|nr:6,7-dimethyl-8-ribityllumazine synthase [Saprospiraceae bacterium]
MASALKNLSHYDDTNIPSAQDMTFGIVVSDWNQHITHALYEGCLDTLSKHGAKEDNIFVVQVPGTFELPAAARLLAGQHPSVDAVICIGCVIKGETKHDEYINLSVANALQNLAIAMSKPFIFGVLTPNTEEQALDRAGGKHGNKGVEAAVTAIRMAALKQDLTGRKKGKIGF